MKNKTTSLIFSFLILSFLLFLLSGCSKLPSDLYNCNLDSDCILMSKNLVKNDCCAWDAINIKYNEWYQQQVNEKVKCNHTCPLLIIKTPTCENNKCTQIMDK